GDGLCVVMKIESHNHPSAIEPYQGAATGVGGIVRDIFAMGARPIAILDSLRFGPLTDAHNRYLFGGVVGGIGGYGNCLGIPTVGGEVVFEEAYSANPLVNAMCVGVAPIEKLVSAKAEGEGNLLMLAGAGTGRDGIHGASGLASRTDPQARFDELRPAVQVGNPFLEKMLMEACLDLAHNHVDWITGIQDLGAAGLTSASLEAANRAGCGLRIDVAKVPRREEGMTPYEVMLSESQERMLIAVRKRHKDDVAALFERWEVPWAIIGEVTVDGYARIYDGDELVAELLIEAVVEAPQYTRDPVRPPELDEMQALDLSALPDIHPAAPAGDLKPALSSAEGVAPTVEGGVAATFRSPGERGCLANDVLLRLLSTPNITSKRWVFRQYDQSVLTNTVVEAGADAAVMRVKGTDRGIALATDGNGRYCHVSPGAGGAIAVAEAARNVVCVGAQPVAVTDCLNFGNPERPEVYYQMQEVIHGMAVACQVLGTPVISGNVSLYNETGGQAVYPTPVVGMLGLLDDVSRHCRPGLTNEGDELFLLGAPLEQPAATLAASEYLKLEHGLIGGRLEIDLDLEARVQRAALAAVRQGLATACHDCSDGGLAVALAEMCLAGGPSTALRTGLGLDASAAPAVSRLDAALFGEAQSRILVAVPPARREELLGIAGGLNVPASFVGRAGGERLRLWSLDLSLAELREAYEGGLEWALAG
ncbi:MAG: phosphoribosylformylglycinamidine synthase subunit PurL, partial [Dehalococcoidia bacterium]|nr:phosphoribosylformylglycinamidine synthase subunit PurL [Dehalococcoidia bacterium]